MFAFAKRLPFLVRHTYHYDVFSSVLDGFYVGTVFQLLLFIGRKMAHLHDWQHNLLMSALHIGLLLTPLIQGFIPLRRRGFVLATWVLARSSCLLFAFPLFHSGWPFAFLATSIIAVTGLKIPAHASIMRSNYPAEVRNRIFSHVRVMQLLVTVPTNLAVGVLIEYRESLYWPLAIFAASISLFGAWQYSHIHPRGEQKGQVPMPLVPLGSIFHILRTDRHYLWYEILYSMGGIPNLWCLPLYVRFIADVDGGLGADWRQIAIMTGLLQPVVMAAALRPWGRLMDHIRTPILQRALVCFVFTFYPLIFTMADSVNWAYLAYAFYGIVTAGASLNWTLGSLAFGEPEQATAYSSIHTMLTGLRGVLAPWIGTLLVGWIGLRSTFFLAACVMLTSSVLLVAQHFRVRNNWQPS